MLTGIINNWERSAHDRDSKFEYMRKLHESLMEAGNLRLLMRDSIVKSICIDTENIYITLNDEYHNMRLIVNEHDYQEVPISVIGFGKYEIAETALLRNMIRKYIANQKRFTFLDIGANVGWYTLNVKKSFENADVYSFEPSPETFNKLKNNLRINGEDCGSAYNIGFYDKNGKMDFYYYEESSGASSLRNTQGKSDAKTISVDVKRLDDWVEEAGIKQVDFIKCDVEGAELFVYGGGGKNASEKHTSSILRNAS